MSTPQDTSSDLVDRVTSVVSGLLDTAGDRLAGAVDKATDILDDGTGGGASALTATLDAAATGLLDKALDAGRAVSRLAGVALDVAKGAVSRADGS